MNILKLIAQLSLDGTRFKSGMREAESFANQSVKRIGSFAAGAFGAGAMTAFVKNIAGEANQLKDWAEQVRGTTDEVQQLKKAADEAGGIGFEGMLQSLVKLNSVRDDAATSNDRLLQKFNKYGITLKELKDPQLRTIDLFKKMVGAMQSLSATDAADLADFFGKSGPKMEATLKAIHALGPIKLMDEADIDRIDKATEGLNEQMRILRANAAKPTSYFLEMLNGAIDANKKFNPAAGGFGLVPKITRALGFRPSINPELDYGGAVGEVTKPPPLSEITPATQERIDKMRIESEKKVAEAALKYRMSTMTTESSKRQELEKQLASKLASERRKRAAAEELLPEAKAKMLGAADEDKIAALGLMAQIQSMKSNPLTDSVAANSQFAGRNLVVDQKESEVVKVAKQQLGIAKETAEAVKELNGKIIGMTTIVGAE